MNEMKWSGEKTLKQPETKVRHAMQFNVFFSVNNILNNHKITEKRKTAATKKKTLDCATVGHLSWPQSKKKKELQHQLYDLDTSIAMELPTGNEKQSDKV